MFTSALVLTHWIPDIPMIVETDAVTDMEQSIIRYIYPELYIYFYYHHLKQDIICILVFTPLRW